MTPLKKCTKCGEEKPLDDFSPRNNGKYRTSACRACSNQNRKLWGLKNPEKVLAHRAKYYVKNILSPRICIICGSVFSPKTRAGVICGNKKCLWRKNYITHKERHLAYYKNKRQQEPEYNVRARKYWDKWRATHPDEYKEYVSKASKKNRELLTDGYIISLLRWNSNIKNPSDEIIDLKRVHIKLKRIQNERKKEHTTNP